MIELWAKKLTPSREKLWDAFIFVSMTAVALVITLPFAQDPLHTLISPINGDAGYSSILFEAIKREQLNPYTDGVITSIANPDGITNNTGVNRASFFSTLLLWMGTLATNAVFTHSLLAISGMVLSGFVTYLFVKKLTNSKLPALIAGLGIMFVPSMISILFSASIYTHMWLYTITIWIFWWLMNGPLSPKRLAIAFALLLPLLFWTPYYTFHILLIASVGVAVTAWSYRRTYSFKTISVFIVTSGAILLAFATVYYLIGVSSQFASIPARSQAEIYQQSAHPLMYVLPGAYSMFGQGLHHLLVNIVPRAAYTSLYVGISVVVIAAASIYSLRRVRSSDRQLRNGAALCLAVVAVMFGFSLAPTIHFAGIDVMTPNYLIEKTVPSLRAGQRLVMPLAAALFVVAGIGLYEIGKRSPKKWRELLLVGLGIVMMADLASMPTARYTLLETRPLFQALSARGEGLVAVYLHDSLVSNPGQYICYTQFQHRMPLVNDCAIQRDPYDFDKPKPKLASLIASPICNQIDKLHKIKVRYLIVATKNNPTVDSCLTLSAHYAPILHDEMYTILEAKR